MELIAVTHIPEPQGNTRAVIYRNNRLRLLPWVDRGDVLKIAVAYCQRRGYEIVGVVNSLAAGEHMIQNEEADVLVVPSRKYLSIRLEIITGEVQVRRPGQQIRPHRLR